MKALKYVSMILIVSYSLVGCSYSDNSISKGDYNELVSNIKEETGYEYLDLETDLMSFVKLVYDPSSQEDIASGLAILEKYCTEDEYASILSDTSEFSQESDSSISDIVMYYFNNKNSVQNNNIWLEFRLTDQSGLNSQMVAIKFGLGDSDKKIYKHSVYYGLLERKN